MSAALLVGRLRYFTWGVVPGYYCQKKTDGGGRPLAGGEGASLAEGNVVPPGRRPGVLYACFSLRCRSTGDDPRPSPGANANQLPTVGDESEQPIPTHWQTLLWSPVFYPQLHWG